MAAHNLESIARSYLDAFERRDLDRCLAFFDAEARIDFQNSEYAGLESIREWHQQRFEANLTMVRLDDIAVNGDTVTVEGVATSNRLRAWRIGSIDGAMNIRFRDEKIAELSFGLRF